MMLQVVVDAFDPNLLVSSCATKVFDFLTVSEADLTDISIPLSLQVRIAFVSLLIDVRRQVLFALRQSVAHEALPTPCRCFGTSLR